jgi:hypothetical protein
VKDTYLRQDTTVSESQRRWRETRRYLNQHRYDLARVAAQLHTGLPQVSPTGLLITRDWLPPGPVPLEQITLEFRSDVPPAQINGSEPASSTVRPLRADGLRYATYADALGALDRPRLFENRTCYRLLEVERDTDGGLRLAFGRGAYFDVVNVSEAVAHELALSIIERPGAMPSAEALALRSLIGDPCDPVRRPLMPAISVLTLRRDRSGEASFILHLRDPKSVTHGGGLYQVMPVGMFQPSHDAEWNLLNDFDLWRSITREYSEEFLGSTEQYGSGDSPIDYEAWPLFQALTSGRENGAARFYWLGLGVDPLSFVTDILVIAVFDGELFDGLFDGLVQANEEGQVVKAVEGVTPSAGIPFSAAYVKRFIEGEPMQAAGAALLRLAWEHRNSLLSEPTC